MKLQPMLSRSKFFSAYVGVMMMTLARLSMASDVDSQAATASTKPKSDAPATKHFPTGKLQGRIQLRHEEFEGVYSNDSERTRADYVARADIELSGKFSKKLVYDLKVEMNEKKNVILKTASLAYRLSKKNWLVVGHFKPEFGMEQIGSSSWTTAIARSAIWDLAPDLSDAKDVHTVGIKELYTSKHFYLSAAGQHRASGYNWTLRVVAAPIHHKRHVLHFGLSYLDERIDNQDGKIRSRLGVRGVSVADNGNPVRLARARDNDFEDDQTGVFEFAYMRGAFSVQSEVLRRQLSGNDGQKSRIATGSYVQLAYTLTGESRNYQQEGGKFSGITPTNKRWGAWEVFYRHDDLQVHGEVGMLKKKRSTANARVDVAGVNVYLNPALRFSANYLQANTQGVVNDVGVDEGKAVSAQIQWLF